MKQDWSNFSQSRNEQEIWGPIVQSVYIFLPLIIQCKHIQMITRHFKSCIDWHVDVGRRQNTVNQKWRFHPEIVGENKACFILLRRLKMTTLYNIIKNPPKWISNNKTVKYCWSNCYFNRFGIIQWESGSVTLTSLSFFITELL